MKVAIAQCQLSSLHSGDVGDNGYMLVKSTGEHGLPVQGEELTSKTQDPLEAPK